MLTPSCPVFGFPPTTSFPKGRFADLALVPISVPLRWWRREPDISNATVANIHYLSARTHTDPYSSGKASGTMANPDAKRAKKENEPPATRYVYHCLGHFLTNFLLHCTV